MVDDIVLDTAHGVVIFDEPELPSYGWASLAGEPARRITQIADLESDGVFISNLSWQNLRSINAVKEPRLRPSNFFREELFAISQDLGIPLFEKPESCLHELSEFFDRSIRLAAKIYGFERIGPSLKETIYQKLFPNGEPYSFGTPKIDDAFSEAYLPIQRCYVQNTNASRNAKLRFSRSHYASQLMAFPLPTGPWSVFKGELPKNTNEIKKGEDCEVYKFLKEFGTTRPALCCVSVRNIDAACGALLGFTNGTERRNWVPIHEAAFLASIAEVTIKKMIEGNSYRTFDSLSYGWKEKSMVGDVSYSLGLVAEAHIAAITSATKKPSSGHSYSPRAVFLKAWDRILLFKTAYILHQQDICVRSFAMGSINVSIEDHQIEFVAKAALEQNMTPPMWLFETCQIDSDLGDGDSEQDVGGNELSLAEKASKYV